MSNPQTLIFDIETIGLEFEKLDEFSQKYITQWAENEEEEKEAKDQLGFSPLTGEIIVIGTLDYEKNQGGIYFQAPGENISDFTEEGIRFKQMTEKEMLEYFWREIVPKYQEFISFNGRSFDGPFLMIRSAYHGIKPTKNLSESRYFYQQRTCVHTDLADQLTFYGNLRKRGGLHLWSRLFGIKSPKTDGISGEEVAKFFKNKKYLEIAKYNLGDLKATKELYEKWNQYLNL